MKLARSFLAFALCFSLVSISSLSLAVTNAAAQDSKTALQRGYRTGYSDGYMAGYRDVIENATRNVSRHPDYKSADRAYSKDYGTLENYRDGYQQGFEIGYDAGYAKKSFDATIPEGLAFRGYIPDPPASTEVFDVKAPDSTADQTPDAAADIPDIAADDSTSQIDDPIIPNSATDSAYMQPVSDSVPSTPRMMDPQSQVQPNYAGDEIIIIPADTELVVELIDEIDTKTAREGDPFKARVVSPSEIAGAVIEGRIAKNRQPGRLKRRAELVLSFDRIVLAKNRWSNFNAFITEVLPIKGDNVKRIDNEGTVEGQRPYKKDSIKLGAATGSGLIIGAIVAGPVGAAIGAGVGAAFGVGAVVVERGKYIHLVEQQQLRIKTAYETQIR